MRKIKTAKDHERVQRRNSMIGVVFVIALLGLSYFGYSLMSAERNSDSVASYAGFDFVREGGRWKLGAEGGSFSFQYLPSEVEDIDVNLSIELGQYSGQPLYFVNMNEGAGEVLNNIGGYILRYQEACMQEAKPLEGSVNLNNLTDNLGNIACGGDFPVKDCESNLIIFENGNETRVYNDANCVYVIGDSVRGIDAFLYKILGIKL